MRAIIISRICSIINVYIGYNQPTLTKQRTHERNIIRIKCDFQNTNYYASLTILCQTFSYYKYNRYHSM